MTNGGNTPEAGIGGDERVGASRMGGRGQNGVECTESSPGLIKPQSFAQVGLLDNEQRRQQLDVVPGQPGSILTVTTASTDVREFLNDFDRRGGQNRSVRYGPDQTLTRLA